MLLKMLGACAVTAPGPIPDPPYYVTGGNRNEVPYTFTNTSSAAYIRMWRIRYQSPSEVSIVNPRVTMTNFLAGASGGELISNVNPFDFRCALEYPLGTRRRYYFDDAGTIEYPVGRGDVVTAFNDPLASDIVIPPSTFYWVRGYIKIKNNDGTPYVSGTWKQVLSQLLGPERNECNMGVSDPLDDRTVVGDMTDVTVESQIFGPSMVWGQPV